MSTEGRRISGGDESFPASIVIPSCVNCGNDGQAVHMNAVLLRNQHTGVELTIVCCTLCRFRWRVPLVWMPILTPGTLLHYWSPYKACN